MDILKKWCWTEPMSFWLIYGNWSFSDWSDTVTDTGRVQDENHCSQNCKYKLCQIKWKESLMNVGSTFFKGRLNKFVWIRCLLWIWKGRQHWLHRSESVLLQGCSRGKGCGIYSWHLLVECNFIYQDTEWVPVSKGFPADNESTQMRL